MGTVDWRTDRGFTSVPSYPSLAVGGTFSSQEEPTSGTLDSFSVIFYLFIGSLWEAGSVTSVSSIPLKLGLPINKILTFDETDVKAVLPHYSCPLLFQCLHLLLCQCKKKIYHFGEKWPVKVLTKCPTRFCKCPRYTTKRVFERTDVDVVCRLFCDLFRRFLLFRSLRRPMVLGVKGGIVSKSIIFLSLFWACRWQQRLLENLIWLFLHRQSERWVDLFVKTFFLMKDHSL